MPARSAVKRVEANATLSLVALLVAALAARMGVAFTRYWFVPMGSFPCAAPADDTTAQRARAGGPSFPVWSSARASQRSHACSLSAL